MEKRVYLNWKEHSIGYLTFENGTYVFNVNRAAQKKAQKANFPSQFLFGDRTRIESETMFSFMEEFIPSHQRHDLRQSCGIQANDTLFEKLVKSAALKRDRSYLWIQAEIAPEKGLRKPPNAVI